MNSFLFFSLYSYFIPLHKWQRAYKLQTQTCSGVLSLSQILRQPRGKKSKKKEEKKLEVTVSCPFQKTVKRSGIFSAQASRPNAVISSNTAISQRKISFCIPFYAPKPIYMVSPPALLQRALSPVLLTRTAAAPRRRLRPASSSSSSA